MARTVNLGKLATLSLAIAAAFGMVSASQAAPTVQGSSVLEVLNFQIQSTDAGHAILDISNFGRPLIADNGTNSASLTGFAPVLNSGNSTNGAPMDILQACLGVVCPGQNNFAHNPAPPAGGTQLSRGDSKLDGAPVTGLGQPTGANARTVAEVRLTGTGTGTGDSRLGLNTSFDFNLAQSRALRFDFDADLYLRAFLSADSLNGSAQASSNLVFAISKVGTLGNIFSWSPNGTVDGILGGTEFADGANLNDSVAALVAGDNNFREAGVKHFTAETNVLGIGSYRFTIRHTSAADANQLIPEPGTLLLAGGALLGLALSRRERKAA